MHFVQAATLYKSGMLLYRFKNSYAVTIAVPHNAVLSMRGTTPRMNPGKPSSRISSLTVVMMVAFDAACTVALDAGSIAAAARPTCNLVLITSIGFVRNALVPPAQQPATVCTGSSTLLPACDHESGSSEYMVFVYAP